MIDREFMPKSARGYSCLEQVHALDLIAVWWLVAFVGLQEMREFGIVPKSPFCLPISEIRQQMVAKWLALGVFKLMRADAA